jgi:hypothetical protein
MSVVENSGMLVAIETTVSPTMSGSMRRFIEIPTAPRVKNWPPITNANKPSSKKTDKTIRFKSGTGNCIKAISIGKKLTAASLARPFKPPLRAYFSFIGEKFG